MKIAIDTGFFIGYLGAHPKVMELWQDFSQDQHTMLVSTIVLNEVFTNCLRRGIGEMAQQWLDSMQALENIELVSVSSDIAVNSARYRVGMQLSTVDSVILSTALLNQCDLLVTSDSDLNQPAIKNLIKVELLPQ